MLEIYARPDDPDRPVVCLDETSEQPVAETAIKRWLRDPEQRLAVQAQTQRARLIGRDLVIHLDAGLLLELGQELDDRPVFWAVEEDEFSCAPSYGAAAVAISCVRQSGRRRRHGRCGGEREGADHRPDPFSHLQNPPECKRVSEASVGYGLFGSIRALP